MISPAPQKTGDIRIAHVIRQFRKGEVRTLLEGFARHADRDRFHHQLVCIGERSPLAGDFESCGWKVVCLGYARGPKPEIVSRLSREFVRGRSDVVHTHGDAQLLYAGPAARFAGMSTVVHTRHRVAAVMSPRQKAIVRFAARLAKRIVCVSEHGVQLAADEGIQARKLTSIRHGIDAPGYRYLGPLPGGPIVSIGRLKSTNGIDTLLRAAAVVVRRRTEVRFDLVGVGKARRELEAVAGELGLLSHVRFLGDLRTHDGPKLLARASVYFHESSDERISPDLLEAMAGGIPIVAVRSGATSEVIEDGVTGRLVSPGDVDGLARVLLEVWPGSDAAARMGRAGREFVGRRFDVRNTISEYESLYLRLLQREKNARTIRPRVGLTEQG